MRSGWIDSEISPLKYLLGLVDSVELIQEQANCFQETVQENSSVAGIS